MEDIDYEILALAGDPSSDEEEDAPMNISRARSTEDRLLGKTSGKHAGRRRPSRRQNDSEEEGEA